MRAREERDGDEGEAYVNAVLLGDGCSRSYLKFMPILEVVPCGLVLYLVKAGPWEDACRFYRTHSSAHSLLSCPHSGEMGIWERAKILTKLNSNI